MASTPSLALRYASLEDVAQDLEMVVQSASQGEWSWNGASKQEEQRWAAFIQDPLSATASTVAGLAGRIQMVPNVALIFSLVSPHEHHEHGQAEEQLGVDATVHLSAPTMSAGIVDKVNIALEARSREWQEEGVFSLFLFDLLTTAQTLVADLAPPDQSGTSNNTQHNPNPVCESEREGASAPARSNIKLARALFWSHHLKARSKLKDLNNWCPELRVWGILRVGYPGYLCFEGESAAVDEMLRRVKALQWHALQLRIHYTWTYTNDTQIQSGQIEQALLSCPFAKHDPDNIRNRADEKVRTGCQVLESLGDLVTRLKACGLTQEEISEALGVRISNA